MTRNEQMLALRDSGLTYRQIAGNYGMSLSRAREICHVEIVKREHQSEREEHLRELAALRANPALRNLRAITWQLAIILEPWRSEP